MAMVQAGMGLGRVALLITRARWSLPLPHAVSSFPCAGLAAPTVLKSGKFSGVLQEKGSDGASSAAELIAKDVTDAKLKLKSIGSDMHNLKDIVMGLDEKMDSIEAKQKYQCAAVLRLCRFVEGEGRLPESLEGLQRTVKRLGDNNNSNELRGLGVRELLAIESERPSGGRMLPSSVFNSARLMLP